MTRIRLLLVAVLTAACLLGGPAAARADVTAFWGLSPTPTSRVARGVSVGINLLVVGFEFEYANTAEKLADAAPGLTTGMINGLVQTPTSKTQFYLTAGGGFYRERLATDAVTSFGTNIGGGIKMGLAGPLRLRLDYRVFTLRGAPLHKTPQRFYAGLNLSF
jgi:hypothetical protein